MAVCNPDEHLKVEKHLALRGTRFLGLKESASNSGGITLLGCLTNMLHTVRYPRHSTQQSAATAAGGWLQCHISLTAGVSSSCCVCAGPEVAVPEVRRKPPDATGCRWDQDVQSGAIWRFSF